MTALWHIIHLLEERVEVLENTLEVSRENISKNEEKCDNLQKQGKRSVYFYFFNNDFWMTSLIIFVFLGLSHKLTSS